MNIQDIREKIKLLQERLNTREIYTVLLILVVGFGSFGLGRLSRLQEGKPSIRVEQVGAAVVTSVPPLLFKEGAGGVVVPAASSTEKPLALGGKYVASKGGTKYYFPWCGSAARISEANKIWFNSVEEARKAGYTPASNCKGLK
ncbi:MAG: hypothetical protein AAB767_04390 [Patescibacteria group bacterium]